MVLGLHIFMTRWDIIKTGTFTHSNKSLASTPLYLLHSELLGTLSSLFLFLCVVSLISTWVLHSIEPAVLYVVTLSYFGFDTFFICFFKY